jgi:hypothetical protein
MPRVPEAAELTPQTGHMQIWWQQRTAPPRPSPLAVTPCRYGAGMNIDCKSTVYGERIEDLLPALLTIKSAMTTDADGMCHASFTLKPKDGAPLQRALMRVEAELLIEDADSIGCQHHQARTHGQRSADALIRLVQAIGEDARAKQIERRGRTGHSSASLASHGAKTNTECPSTGPHVSETG